MRLVCGVDGCKDGWVAISKDLDTQNTSWRFYATIHELVYSDPTLHVIAIDIPIGLPDRGARLCDLEARQLVGPRRSSIFPAPIRALFAATSHQNASQIRFQVEEKKLSIQAGAIIPKIRDVDRALIQDPELKMRVREVHPEVCFYFLAGRQHLQYSKRKQAGREERGRLLSPVFGGRLNEALSDRTALKSSEDDILDAFVALWTAERIALGNSQSIPSDPTLDRFGLRMEMVI